MRQAEVFGASLTWGSHAGSEHQAHAHTTASGTTGARNHWLMRHHSVLRSVLVATKMLRAKEGHSIHIESTGGGF